jgi:hypothetical protein
MFEPLAVCALFALVAGAILATYWRLEPGDLYHVSGNGLEGGASRVLVFTSWPLGLVAVPVAWIAAARLSVRWAILLASAATVLVATIALPGVIDQNDLDVRPVNGLAGAGVLLALGLLGLSWARGRGGSAPFHPADWLRLAVAAVLLVWSLPWLWAELGFYISDAPGLGSIFIAEEIKPSLGGEPSLHAVHLGEHHGLDGTLLALSALALSRVPAHMPSRRGVVALTAYVSLLLVYGLSLSLQDGWNEQLVKRGAVDSKLPTMIRPDLSWAWLALVLAALGICWALLRVGRVNRLQGGTR